MILCAPPTASVSVITTAEAHVATVTSDEEGTFALRVQALVKVLRWDSSQLMWLLLQFVHLQTYIHHDLMLCFFSGTGELSQILWPLSHDFWTLEELLPDLSDHFGVQGKATFPTGLHISKAWKELWNGFSVVQADSEDGLLLYCGENEHGRGDFTSLALVRSKLHYRWRKPWLTYQLRFWKVWLVDKNGKMCFMSAGKQECRGEHRGW